MEDYDIKKDKEIATDILRFKKNSLSATFVYLALIFNVLYLILIYKLNNEFFYRYVIGLSVLTNLLFMLFSFLTSEEVKNYKKKFNIIMFVLALVQIVRIFVFPLIGHKTIISVNGVDTLVMGDKQFIYSVIYLSLSAISLIIGGIIAVIRTDRYEKHLRKING